MTGRLGTLGLIAVAALALCGITGAATTPIFSTVPVMYINYNADCTFTFTIDGGITVGSSGTQIPPGPYQLQIRTAPDGNLQPVACPSPSFQISGPGVSYTTNNVGGAGGPVQATQTFQAGATYVAVDGNHPSLGQKVFTTATTGTSSSLLPPPPPDTSTGVAKQTDLIGSAIVPFRGTLRATVESSARATLVDGGKAVTALTVGRYDIVAADKSATDGLFLQKHGKKPLAITGVAYTGTRTVKVDLTAGTWTVFTKHGLVKTFSVKG